MFGIRKLESWAIVQRCVCDPKLSRFGTIQACNGRTNPLRQHIPR